MGLAACFLGSLYDLLGDYFAMRRRDSGLLHFARNTFLDKVAQAKTDFGYVSGRNGRRKAVSYMRRDDYSGLVSYCALLLG